MSLHSQSTGGGNGFESINLASTVALPSIKNRKQSSRSIPQHSIPESTSEDDEPVPQEFLFTERPEIDHDDRKSPVHTLDNDLTPHLLNSEFFLNPSKILDSQVLPETFIPNGSMFNSNFEPSHDFSIAFKPEDQDSPLEYLQSKNTTLYKEIRKNIRNHRVLLEQGSEKLNKVRSMISQDFDQLSENFYSLNEIYSRDAAVTENLLKSFEIWDKKRDKLLNKIKVIKSMDNKHGHKLGQLIEQSSNVDAEITDLEKRLASAKERKRLLSLEIDKTSSVLESRTSKYVESFKRLEKEGQNAVADFFRLNGMPEKDLGSVIKKQPVNVKFSRNQQEKAVTNNIILEKAPVAQKTAEQKPAVAAKPAEVTPVRAESMGMQPFIIPDDPPPTKPTDDNTSLNHDKGPTAFEKGFAKGSQKSLDVKSKLVYLLKLIKESSNSEKDRYQRLEALTAVKVDDADNTIESKMDVDPIVTLLVHKIEALEDLVLETSRKSTEFHEYSLRWKDLIEYVKNEEYKLSTQISNSIESQLQIQSKLVNALTSMLRNLKHLASLESLKPSLSSNSGQDRLLLQTANGNEIRNVYLALKVISDPSQYQSIADDFRRIGYNDID